MANKEQLLQSMWALVHAKPQNPENFGTRVRNTYYCFTCQVDNLSLIEVIADHEDCWVLENLTYDGYYCHRKEEIDRVSYDTSNIRVYRHRSEDVYFLKPRRIGGTSDNRKKGDCVTCYYPMKHFDTDQPALYCSLLCKLRVDMRQQNLHHDNGDGRDNNDKGDLADDDDHGDADDEAAPSTKKRKTHNQEPPQDVGII